jgi:translation initiation factor eIF-2B subunit beta
MPSTAVALTPGLASFLKSLKTNPIDTSIDNLVAYVPQSEPVMLLHAY